MGLKTRSWAQLGIFCICALAGVLANAATVEVRTKVSKTMVHGQLFGLCLFQILDEPPGLDCPSTWVSASCSGDFNPSNVGWRKYEVAQMAQMLGREVIIQVDDALKHNGQCFAKYVLALER
ncbi:MAG: hypothetical protein AAF541_06240 [Pseudomonadota bacterium]